MIENRGDSLNKFHFSQNFFRAAGQLFQPFSLSFSAIFVFLQLISTSLQKKSADFLTFPLNCITVRTCFVTTGYNVSNRTAWRTELYNYIKA